MGRRSEIVSPRYVLRDLVLKHGGRMSISQIRNSHEFRGHDADEIRQLVYQLRKEGKGKDFGKGQEAWELVDSVVIGLERCLTQRERWKIQKRRHAKERGVAEQGMLDNVIFEGKIALNGVTHKKEIVRGLKASTKDLGQAAKSSDSVRETLVEHEEDFGDKDNKD